MATSFQAAKAALAPYVDNGIDPENARVTARINEAQRRLIDHYNFLSRREELEKDPLVYVENGTSGYLTLDDLDATKVMILALWREENNELEIATGLEQKALAFVERNLMAEVQRARRVVTGEVGRLHNELPEGLKFSTSRLTTLLGQAATEATAHLEFLQRREEFEGPTLTASFEVRKKLVESYLATSQAAVEPAMALKKDALDLLERDTIAAVHQLRKATTGEVGRLHNELATGLKVPTSRMTTLLNQAVNDAIAHQKFLQKPDDDDFAAPPITFEIKRALVESYLAAMEGAAEVALGLKKTALDLIQRDVEAHDQTLRRTTRYDLSLTSPNSFGYHWGRVGLGFENSLTFSNNAIKRAVTSAEESLMNSGKWVGTIAEYTLTLSNSGEVFLPREIETVLFVSFDGDPRPVHDRFAEYMTGGTGIRTTENPGRSGFSDLGDSVDSVDGKTKRKYFVTVPQEDKATVIRYLAKRRFVPHTSDSEPMYLNNYEAIAQAAMAILTNGQQGNFEAAKQLLAAQVYQQYFKPQLYGVHNKPVLALR
jgi:hypothetical protein